MIYELAHFIKDKCTFLWDTVEWGNASLFALLYKEKLRGVPELLDKMSNDVFTIRATQDEDVERLVAFFAEQPESAFEFFNPHGFDEKSVLKVLKNKAFQTFVVAEGESIVGYFFLRSFVNGKCFRGRMADHKSRGKGIGKLMAKAIEEIATFEGLRMFASISPENLASLNSAKVVSDVKIIKMLENGYYYIECTPKDINRGVGVDYQIVVMFGGRVCNLKLAA